MYFTCTAQTYVFFPIEMTFIHESFVYSVLSQSSSSPVSAPSYPPSVPQVVLQIPILFDSQH